MNKRSFRPKVRIEPPVGGVKKIAFHGNNQQQQSKQTMKRQRSAPAAPGLISSSPGRPLRLQSRAENDGDGEEEASGSIKRKISKITRRGEDDSVQIIFDTTGNVPQLKNPDCDSKASLQVPDLVLVDKTRNPPRVYERGMLLGKGGFAKVYSVTERSTGVYFADKVINKEIFIFKKRGKARAKEKVEREIRIHKKMSHVNIIKFYNFFEDANFVHMILELAPQQTLLHVSRMRIFLTEPEVKYYFRQIAAGTNYIHSQGILHRDLKLGNMFLSSNMIVKIGDFGLSTTFTDNSTSLCGTPNYVSPEIIAKRGHSVGSEIWSIGCIVYALLCGKPPFDSKTVDSTYALIKSVDYKVPPYLSCNAVNFISRLLAKDPQARGSLCPTDRYSLLNHRFILEGFTPDCLPASALTKPPELLENLENPHQVKSRIDESQAVSGCSSKLSPSFSSSLRRMKDFFNSRSEFLVQVMEQINAFLTREDDLVFGPAPSIRARAREVPVPIFICKWVDFSKQFGFIFQLSDGSVGVLFNDDTKMGISVCRRILEFTDAKGRNSRWSIDENSNMQLYQEIKEKYLKLKPFISYMEKNLNDTKFDRRQKVKRVVIGQKTSIPLLKTWQRSGADQDSVAMELSSKTVQVNFMKEHIKVLIWTDTGADLMVTSIFSEAVESRVETFSLVGNNRFQVKDMARWLLTRVENKVRDMIK